MPEDQLFEKLTSADITKSGNEFENCRFKNCDFSYGSLSGIRFADCEFADCNISLTDVSDTAMQNVQFTGCKLSGVHFDRCSKFLFEVNFINCTLDNAIFYKVKNKKARFTDCSLIETDFTEADLSNTEFNNCNFQRTTFFQTQLTGADFSTSYNFIIDPEVNRIAKAKFSLHGLPGLLSRHAIVISN